MRVAPGQSRFVLPQLSVDARGVAQGRDMVLRLPTMERLVTFLRFISADLGLDELGSELRIRFAHSAHGTREVLLLIDHISLHAFDAVVRTARAAQGQVFTGIGRHFVAVRDTQSPLGYDVEELSSAAGDLVLYAADQQAAFVFDGELSVQQLLLRLPLQRQNDGPASLVKKNSLELLYLTVRRGLGPALVETLHHAGVSARAAQVQPGTTGDPSFWLVRIENPPARLWGLFSRTPGLMPFVPVNDNVLVAVGYRHPVHLDACRSILPEDGLVLFAPPPSPPRLIAPAPVLLPIGDLVRLPASGALSTLQGTPLIERLASAPIDLRSQLALVHVPPTGEAPVATLVPWPQVAWIKRLCVALPQAALQEYRIAALTKGLLIVANADMQWLPFGTLLGAVAKGVLVPVGYALRPAVSPTLLEERLATGDGSFVVFLNAHDPFRVQAHDLIPMQAHVLGELVVPTEHAGQTLAPADQRPAPDIRYRSGMPMPLWGQE